MTGDRRPETIAAIGEFGLIERIRRQLESASTSDDATFGETPDLLVGIGDDAALLRPEPGWDLAVTCDVQVCGRHFDSRWTEPLAIGRRAMVVTLSDIAAMGAEPRHALVSLGLPGSMAVAEVEEMYRGFLEALSGSPARVIGGNLTASGADWFIDITLIGRVESGRALTRAGASPGDRILVTGFPGRSAAGLAILRAITEGASSGSEANGSKAKGSEPNGESRDLRREVGEFQATHPWARSLVRSFLQPEARITVGRWLAQAADRPATSLVDLSDGLVGDLAHICERSGVQAVIDAGRFPDDPGLEWASRHFGRDRASWTVGPSDDYELLLTVRPGLANRVAAELQAVAGLPVTEIGEILPPAAPGSSPTHESDLVAVTGLPPGSRAGSGWDHFA